MGTWGPAIFADDDAADLRDEYRLILAGARSDSAATDEAALQYAASFDRIGDTTSFWLALALIQWRMGRVDPRVRDAALRIIDDGIDLARWDESPFRRKRAAALQKARATIASPPPDPKPLPKPPPVQLPGWEFSEVVAYPMPNGRVVLLHHLNYRAWSTVGTTAPVVSILNWVQSRIPDARELEPLTYVNHDGVMPAGHHLLCLAMPRSRALRETQFIRTGHKKPVTRGEASSAIRGIGGHEGLTLDIALTRVLHPYWSDPSLPAHLPKEFPADRPDSQASWEHWRNRLAGRI